VPVWKYRSVEEMPEAWTMNLHLPAGIRIRSLMKLHDYAGPLEMPRGVQKFQSVEELQADREQYEQERIERIRARYTRK